MNKTTKIVSAVVIVGLVIGYLSFALHPSAQPATKSPTLRTLKLGLMLPLSGDYAVAGENMQKGMDLALEQYNKDHPGSIVETVVEDDGYDTKKGVSAYNKLVNLDHVDAILMLSTPVIDAIHEDAVKRGLPIIQLGVQTAGVANDNIFQFSPAAEAPIGYLAKYLGDDQNFYSKKVAVIYDNSPAQLSFFNAFKNGYTHDFTPFVVNSKNDFRGYAAKIAKENYDAVVFIESSQNGALATKEILTLDKTAPTFAYDAQIQTGFADYSRILGDTNKINGSKSMWFKEGKSAEFKQLYKDKYAAEPGFLADFAYDMINVALKTHNTDNYKWVANLQKVNDPNGVSGSISFDDKGVRVQPMTITEIRDGKLVPVQ